MGSKHALAIAALLMAGLATTVGAQQAQSTNQVDAKTDWSVFVDGDPKECWSVSAPKETVNTRDGRVVSVRRSEILLYVFYRPGADVKGQLTFTGGYPFADASTVNLEIAGSDYVLITDGEWAWSASEGEDAKIVAAMKQGAQAVLRRGTTTKDTFSLLGFTAAVEDAEKRCS